MWKPDWVNVGDQFGANISARGVLQAAGAHRHNGSRGAVGVRNIFTGKQWKIEVPGLESKDQFGSKVKLHGSKDRGQFLTVSGVGYQGAAGAVWTFRLELGEWVEIQ